MTASNFNYGN